MTLAGTERPDGLEKGTTLSHLIGIKDEDVHFLPDLSKTASSWRYMENEEKIEHLVNEHKVPRAKLGQNDFSQTYSDSLDDIHAASENKTFYDRMGPSGPGTKVAPHTHTGTVGKTARRDFSEREKYALIEEDGEARNVHKLDTTGTHYEDQSAAEIARMILPLKGL